jgi:hypothetical protein
LDNASIHHTNNVEAIFNDLCTFGYEVLFLPPYSPFLNPIEYAFSKIKGLVGRSHFSNRDELVAAVTAATHEVTAGDARGWFRHIIRYYSMCAFGLPFRGSPLNPDWVETTAAPSQLKYTWQQVSQFEPLPPSTSATCTIAEL